MLMNVSCNTEESTELANDASQSEPLIQPSDRAHEHKYITQAKLHNMMQVLQKVDDKYTMATHGNNDTHLTYLSTIQIQMMR